LVTRSPGDAKRINKGKCNQVVLVALAAHIFGRQLRFDWRMITKDHMMGVLLDACPSFGPHWQAFQDEWRTEADDLPLYPVLAEFARHLIAMIEKCNTSRLPSIFAAIERLEVEGDRYVREATTVGLLEDLQNMNLHENGTEPEFFRSYLGPVSEKWWDKLYRMLQHGELLSDD
jgi:hypothetical protein